MDLINLINKWKMSLTDFNENHIYYSVALNFKARKNI